MEPDRLGVPVRRWPPRSATRSSSSTASCTSASRATPASAPGRRRPRVGRRPPARRRRQPAAAAGDGQRRRAGRGGHRSAAGTTRPRRRSRARPRRADASRSAAAGAGRGRPRRASSAAARSSRPTCRSTSAEVAQDAADSLVEQLGSAADRARRRGLRQPGAARRRHGQPRQRRRPVRRQVRADVVPPHLRPDERVPDGVPCQRPPEPDDARARQRLAAAATARRCSGVVPAIVSNLDDPDELGRMKVTFPWLGDKAESPLGARGDGRAPGNKRGLVVLPEVGDEVLVAFDHGDPRLPYVIGGLYNGKDKLPVEPVDGGKVVKRALVVAQRPPARARRQGRHRSRSPPATASTRIVLDQKGSKIVLETTGDVEVDVERPSLPVKAPSGHDAGVQRRRSSSRPTASRSTPAAARSAPRARQAKVEGSGTRRAVEQRRRRRSAARW